MTTYIREKDLNEGDGEYVKRDYDLYKEIDALREVGLLPVHLERWIENNRMKEEGTEFYSKARRHWKDTQYEQIEKGRQKYPEPFNPHSWTPKELLDHALQENVDQAHYLVGLYDKLVKLEEDNAMLREQLKYALKGSYVDERC